MTKEMKKAGFALCGGVFLIILGIFFLFLLSRSYNPVAYCLDRDDFYPPIAMHNVYIFAAFCAILIGVIMELAGRFKLAKAINDMKIFYNRLNLYFIATIFILVSIKNWMAANDYLFFVRSCVSKRMYGFLDLTETLVALTILFLFILLICFLLKDYIYLSRVFKSKLPTVTLAVCIISILLFFSKGIFGSFLSYEYREFLESLMSIKVFIPYLVMCFIMYLFMRSSANEAKDFSIYDFISNKKKILFILIAATLITAIVSRMFAVHKLEALSSFYGLSIPLLFMPLLLFFRVIIHFKFKILLIALIVILGILLISFGLYFFQSTRDFLVLIGMILLITSVSYSFIVPISLALCAVFKLQQYNFTKSSIVLIAVSCAVLGYFAVFS
jgi:hypothetical protein